jgi:hypothetical protein
VNDWIGSRGSAMAQAVAARRGLRRSCDVRSERAQDHPAGAVVPSEDGFCAWWIQSSDWVMGIEYEKGIRWMPWHQEAMKDVARCEKPRGAASRR